jgi:hypothetical protein
LTLPEPARNQKPTVGFQARFFWEQPARRKFPAINGLQVQKSPKTEKTRKKMSFFSRRPPDFLPNGVILGPFLSVKLFIDLQAVDDVALARIEKQRFIEKIREEVSGECIPAC